LAQKEQHYHQDIKKRRSLSSVESAQDVEQQKQRIMKCKCPNCGHVFDELEIEHLAEDEKEKIVVLIKNTVARYYFISPRLLEQRTRTMNVAEARHVAMVLVRKFCTLSLKETGKYFGKRDHTTVLYAFQRAKNAAFTKTDLYEPLLILEEKLQQMINVKRDDADSQSEAAA
jgi:hypothetical protein